MITSLLRPLFAHRYKIWREAAANIESAQRQQLDRLLSKGNGTLYGEQLHFNSIDRYETFRRRVPVVSYEYVRPLVMRMINGEQNVLWPGRVCSFAQSSGTSDGKSKYVPVTADSLRYNHYRGAFDTVSHYLHAYKDSRLFEDGHLFSVEVLPMNWICLTVCVSAICRQVL